MSQIRIPVSTMLPNFNIIFIKLFHLSVHFVTIFRCEPPGHFMSAHSSHHFKSSILPPVRTTILSQSVPPWSDIYFPDNKNAGCLLFHQSWTAGCLSISTIATHPTYTQIPSSARAAHNLRIPLQPSAAVFSLLHLA